MNTSQTKAAKNYFEKDLFKLMNNSVFGKNSGICSKTYRYKNYSNRDGRIFCVRTEVSYYKDFCRKFVGFGNKKNQILMSKPVYLALSILDLSKTVMYEFWYDYVQLKYGKKAKLCYMDTDICTCHIKKMTFTKTLQKILKQDLTP